MGSQKGISTVMILLVIGLVAVLAVGGYFVWQSFYDSSESDQIACTQDVKLCPDGSYVSRTGPKCEFAQCPASNQPTEWIDLANPELGFELKYPSNFFDAGHEPKIFSVKCSYKTLPQKCPDLTAFIPNSPTGSPVKLEKININGDDYCKYSLSDAATGHVYYYDYYATAKNQKCIVIELDTSSQNCDFYLPLQDGNLQQKQNYENCLEKNERRPKILEQIISTFQFPK